MTAVTTCNATGYAHISPPEELKSKVSDIDALVTFVTQNVRVNEQNISTKLADFRQRFYQAKDIETLKELVEKASDIGILLLKVIPTDDLTDLRSKSEDLKLWSWLCLAQIYQGIDMAIAGRNIPLLSNCVVALCDFNRCGEAIEKMNSLPNLDHPATFLEIARYGLSQSGDFIAITNMAEYLCSQSKFDEALEIVETCVYKEGLRKQLTDEIEEKRSAAKS